MSVAPSGHVKIVDAVKPGDGSIRRHTAAASPTSTRSPAGLLPTVVDLRRTRIVPAAKADARGGPRHATTSCAYPSRL